jgi:hypothetical protein
MIAWNPNSNPAIRKYQVNPTIRKHQVQTPLLGSIRSTLQSGSTKFKSHNREISIKPCNQEKREKNPVFRKFSRKGKDQLYHQEASLSQPAIKKHQVFKPHNREILG